MITSEGYIGQVKDGAQMARTMGWSAGRRYWSYSPAGGGLVTPVTAGNREIQLSDGPLGAYGVTDIIDNNAPRQTHQLPATPGYYLACMRRTWGPSRDNPGLSSIVSHAMPAIDRLPTTRETRYGIVDDQPLAVVQVVANQTRPVIIRDVRLYGTGDGVMHAHPAAADYVKQYMRFIGSQFRAGNVLYSYEPLEGGQSEGWVAYPGPYGRVALPVLRRGEVVDWQDGWGHGGDGLAGSTAVIDGNTHDVFLQARKYTTPFLFDQYGGISPDVEIGRVKERFWPGVNGVTGRAFFWGGLRGDNDAFYTNACDVFLNAQGGIIIRGGAPSNHQITRRAGDNDAPSLEVRFVFVKPDPS